MDVIFISISSSAFSLVSDWHFVDAPFYKTTCLVDACGLRWSETLIKLIWWVICFLGIILHA